MIARDNWLHWSALLDEVLDLEPSARAPWLADLAARDAAAATAVQRLLARETENHGTTSNLLQLETTSPSRQQFEVLRVQ